MNESCYVKNTYGLNVIESSFLLCFFTFLKYFLSLMFCFLFSFFFYEN